MGERGGNDMGGRGGEDMGGRGGEDMGGRGGNDMGGRGGDDMGGRGGEDSTNSIGCSAHTQYMSTPLTTSLHNGSWAVGLTLPHPPAPPTLRCYCTVECIAVHQHTLQTAPAVSLEDVDGADGTFDLTLLVGPLHCHCCLHNHVGEEVSITAGH